MPRKKLKKRKKVIKIKNLKLKPPKRRSLERRLD
jgi:hypothetical protein